MNARKLNLLKEINEMLAIYSYKKKAYGLTLEEKIDFLELKVLKNKLLKMLDKVC